MALPVTFGPLTAASMGQLDQNFTAAGALTTIQCSSTGSNAIVLTPAANQPAVNGYGLPNPLKFGFLGPAASSGPVTLEINAVGFLPVYTSNGVQATSGTLQSGVYYEVTYTTGSVYNSGSGAWVLSSYQASTGVTAVANASVNGLSIANNAGTPNTKIDATFTQACLVSAVGAPVFIASGSFTIDLTLGTVTSAANGMDGEARPTSGWVYLYAISTGAGSAGLGTTVSPLAGLPTLPAGYSFYAYIGAMRCDGSQNLMRSRQLGSDAQYVITAATNTTAMPTMTSGSASLWTAVAVAAFIPATASTIKGALYNASPGNNTGGGVAPNNAYVAVGNAPINFINSTGTTFGSLMIPFEMEIESANIYYTSTAGSASILFARGWRDYVSATG